VDEDYGFTLLRLTFLQLEPVVETECAFERVTEKHGRDLATEKHGHNYAPPGDKYTLADVLLTTCVGWV